MSDSVIVLVTGDGDPKQGEITLLESPQKAERLVETLLEAGFERERIRVFSGIEVEMQVRYRPVVSLDGDGPGAGEDQGRPDAHESGQEAGLVAADVGKGKKGSDAADSYTKGGLRFSSMFRSA